SRSHSRRLSKYRVKGLLVYIEIERGDPLAGLKQRHNDVHGKGGFAAAALLISDDDDVRQRLHVARWYDRGTHYRAKPLLRHKVAHQPSASLSQTRNLTSNYT